MFRYIISILNQKEKNELIKISVMKKITNVTNEELKKLEAK